jgi:hypothetical protein
MRLHQKAAPGGKLFQKPMPGQASKPPETIGSWITGCHVFTHLQVGN